MVSTQEPGIDIMPVRIAIIGGGISGASLFHFFYESDAVGFLHCDLYDQGRAVGGRTSTRFVNNKV